MTINLRQGQIEPNRLDLRVEDSHIPEEFGPSDFEPTNIIGVIDDSHGIGIGIDGADFNRCSVQTIASRVR